MFNKDMIRTDDLFAPVSFGGGGEGGGGGGGGSSYVQQQPAAATTGNTETALTIQQGVGFVACVAGAAQLSPVNATIAVTGCAAILA